MDSFIKAVVSPNSVVVVGASENPDKIGGRPLAFMQRFGYTGRILAVNPKRSVIQGVPSYPSLRDLPYVPDLAYIALAGDAAIQAVEDCAAMGVKVALVIASGFGETGPQGLAAQRRMVNIAREKGMRIVGPNTQGLANFGSGAIASFSSLFIEMPPADGPIAVISQSGAMCSVAYGQLRERGIGVRYANATGNEADVTVSEIACAVAQDPAIKIMLLYFESIPDPEKLAEAAAIARERGVTIVAIKAGRTAQGQQVASSHTGAMANEDRVVEAFFKRHGIWRAQDTHEQVRCVEMILKGWQPRGRNLAVVSNSGASCVIAADMALTLNLPLATLSETTQEKLAALLPGFAATRNPIDITAALLSDSSLFGSVLPLLQSDPAVHLLFINIPVSGAAYDVAAFARDTAAFIAASGMPVAVCAWQEPVAQVFKQAGVPTFRSAEDALQSLAQIAGHAELQALAAARILPPTDTATRQRWTAQASAETQFLSEAQSLACLAHQGVPVVPHQLCQNANQAQAAFNILGPIVVVKACSTDIPHKSDHGLVALKLNTETAVREAFESQWQTMQKMQASTDGIIVAAMAHGRHEFMIGAKLDPVFGPVVLIGDGGKYVEALQDIVLLLPPFDLAHVKRELKNLRIAALFDGVRGEHALDIDALASIAIKIGNWMIDNDQNVVSIDLNPVMVNTVGHGAVVLDALIEQAR